MALNLTLLVFTPNFVSFTLHYIYDKIDCSLHLKKFMHLTHFHRCIKHQMIYIKSLIFYIKIILKNNLNPKSSDLDRTVMKVLNA